MPYRPPHLATIKIIYDIDKISLLLAVNVNTLVAAIFVKLVEFFYIYYKPAIFIHIFCAFDIFFDKNTPILFKVTL